MRALRMILVSTVVGGTLIACNFIVEAQFKDKVLPGQDGSVTSTKCNGFDLGATSCSACMQNKCGTLLNTVCGDKNVPYGTTQDLSLCGKNPSIIGSTGTGNCSRVYLDAAPVSAGDLQGSIQNLRVCITQNCESAGNCLVCTGLTYKRFSTDTDHPIEDAGACATCLLNNCNDVLIGQAGIKGHCCYNSQVSEMFGSCITTEANYHNCNNIMMWAGGDSSTDPCKPALANCAQNCQSECNF